MTQATVGVVLLLVLLVWSQTRETTGAMEVLFRTLQPFVWVGIFLLGVTLLVGWRIALRDRARTRAAFRTRQQLADLSPEQFERWCETRLKEAGYRTWLVGGQADHGIDLEAERDGRKVVVQCKRYAGARVVGEPQLRDLYGAMHAHNAAGAILITAGSFSSAARAWASGKPIELWDVEHLARLPSSMDAITSIGPQNPAQVEPCPRCHSALVERTNRTTGETFIGCSGFPRCRFTKQLAIPAVD